MHFVCDHCGLIVEFAGSVRPHAPDLACQDCGGPLVPCTAGLIDPDPVLPVMPMEGRGA